MKLSWIYRLARHFTEVPISTWMHWLSCFFAYSCGWWFFWLAYLTGFLKNWIMIVSLIFEGEHIRRGIEVVITGLTRNHVHIWVVVPPKTAEKPWFCWIFSWLMIFLTGLSNGFSKKLNNDCFPRFWGWTYTERYRSGHNGADSKSVCAKAHKGSNPFLSAKARLSRSKSRKDFLAVFAFRLRGSQTSCIPEE